MELPFSSVAVLRTLKNQGLKSANSFHKFLPWNFPLFLKHFFIAHQTKNNLPIFKLALVSKSTRITYVHTDAC
jgi:hypothetical protein